MREYMQKKRKKSRIKEASEKRSELLRMKFLIG